MASTRLRPGPGVVAFTDRRVLFLKEGPFMREGAVDREIPWTDIRSITCSMDKDPRLGPDLILKDGKDGKDTRWNFTSTASLTEVTHLADVLNSRTTFGAKVRSKKLARLSRALRLLLVEKTPVVAPPG